MREIFHRELEELGDKLVEMGHKVAEAVDHAGRALREADLELAQAVIDADNRIDELEDEIEHMSLTMLARQQPVATDLRLVVSALRLSATLERMGDLARNIASIVRTRYPDRASSGAMLDALIEMSHAASDITHMLIELME
ncbi:MAG: phosphate transport system regulatory protein PhoU, partial [Actinomycetes bacterium]|nr:phosphate transport system regulatory protein PhoU [Actinomycetes bacterium]MDX5380610.1 phosphate transport system regulatory protein PhoU [Actinomycetes bacterium]MDX5399544.1 phosphate transport system regulatory protein PhoU [Actinomycetes bacterium]MDX5450353.1 phosphate transport system regulatory protein PhoU [Actinomycetes bacterium]